MEDLDQKKLDLELTQPQPEIKIELTLLSTNKNILKMVCRDFIAYAQQQQVPIPEPKELETARGKITTRKSPCGQGTATWSKYKIFVYGRRLEFKTTHNFLEKTAAFLHNTDVEITLKVKA